MRKSNENNPTGISAAPKPAPLFTRLAVLALMGAVCGTLLELGTLFGAPGANPLDLDRWVWRRLIIFSVGSFLALCILHFGGARDRFLDRLDDLSIISDRIGDALLRLLAAAVAALALALVGFFLLSAQLGSDLRYAVFVFCVVFAVMSLFLLRDTVVDAPEWGFLLLSLTFGTALIAFMPTISNVSWDGQVHFNRANAMSYLYEPYYTGADALMASDEGFRLLENPDEDIDFPVPVASFDDAFMDASDAELQRLEDEGEVIVLHGTEMLGEPTWVSERSIGSLPNAIGLWLGRLLHLPCVWRYELGRFCGLLFYSLVMFFAIRRLKYRKLVLASIAMLPVCLFLAANYSYDMWCFAFIAYSLARFAGWLQNPDAELGMDDIVAIIGSFFIGCIVKAIYFPLAGVFLFAPGKLERSCVSGGADPGTGRVPGTDSRTSTSAMSASPAIPKHASHFRTAEPSEPDAYTGRLTPIGLHESDHEEQRIAIRILRIAACIMVALLVASFALPFLLNTGGSSDARGGEGVSSGGQLSFILADPMRYLRILFNFSLYFLDAVRLGTSLPLQLAYIRWPETDYLNIVSMALLGLTLLCAVLDQGNRRGTSHGLRIMAVVGPVCSFLLSATALYISYTPYGLDTINGMQYRYLLPIALPLLMFTLELPLLNRVRLKHLPLVVYFVMAALWSFALYLPIVSQFS